MSVQVLTSAESVSLRACPHCGGRRLKVRFREASFVIVRCRDCRLVYLGNPPAEENLYEDYHEGALSTPAPYRADSPDPALAQLFVINEQRIQAVTAVKPAGTLMDIGCGRGYFVRTAADHGFTAAGTDVSQRAVDFARQRLGVPASKRTLGDLVRAGERFDIVTLWHVLEHFLDPFEVLRQVHDLLKEGGVCFVEVPNLHSLKFMLARRKWQGGNHPLYHRTFFTSRTLHRALKEAGFSSIERLPLSYRVPGHTPAYSVLKRILNGAAMDAFLTFAARK